MTFLEKLKHIFTVDTTPQCSICGISKAIYTANMEPSVSYLGPIRVDHHGRRLYACGDCLPAAEGPWRPLEQAS